MRLLRRATVALAAVAAAGAGAACGDTGFDSPTMVTDLRILGMQAEPPEVIVDIDLQNPDISQLDVPPVTFTVLAADPGAARTLTWTMTACARNRDGLCQGDDTDVVFASGTADDPEMPGATPITATFEPGIPLLMAALDDNALQGAAGIPIHVELRVEVDGGEAGGGETAWAYKREYYTPRIPAERQANRNPGIEELRFSTVEGGAEEGEPVPAGRCGDATATPVNVAPGAAIELFPAAVDGSAEMFVLPTIEGEVRTFTEALEYSWYVTAGGLDDGETGGTNPLDPAPPVENTWTAPEEVGPVTLWLVQRDRRGGMSWIERCLLVE